MIAHKGNDGWKPSPGMLAAYADGELDGAGPSGDLRKLMDAWLAEYPEAVADVEAQQQVRDWCLATSAADPGEPAWSALAERLRSLPLAPPATRRRWSRVAWIAGIAASAAAILWIAVTLWPSSREQEVARHTPPGQVAPLPDREEPAAAVLEVATAAEVEILSVQGDDTGTLVVGELPLQGSLVLLQPGEVTLTSIEPAPDNMVPEIRTGQAAPMIWAPLEDEREDPQEPNHG